MKITLIVDDYFPKSIKVAAKMMHELAIELIKKGHEVYVITPDSDLKENYKVSDIYGVKVLFFKSGKIKNVNYLKRVINEFLLSFRAWKYLKNEIKQDGCDLVVYYSPSIFWSHLVRKIKRQFKCKSFLILRDLFPQWVIDNGMIKKYSPIALYFKFFEKLNYKYADTIALQSPANLEWFNRTHNKKNNKNSIVMYNWADNNPVKSDGNFRKKHSLEDKIIYFYGGNIGHAQDMSNIMQLAQKMLKHENAHFLLLGDGDELQLIKDYMINKNLKNVTILPPVSQQEFKKILSEIDVGLFSLNKFHKTHNFPGKLLGYMVQSIPILGSVNPGNDLIDLINSNDAGLVSINGEYDLFLEHAEILLKESERKVIGANANKLLKKYFSVESATDVILKN